ncbi:MAG: tRNA-dihydrouridine synthase family protein [Firmicutes bacterium]|nr:tRNA-dihydrouridine synthase family protein [Bacillota bacterium]
MAGYTDVAFRSLCAGFGASLTTTEMVSVLGLMHNSKATHELLFTEPNESPKEVQLFGSNPEAFSRAAGHPFLEKFDIININMGCPVPKVFKQGEGCALMANPELAYKIITACTKNTNKPVTVKFRLGLTADTINAAEFGKMCEQAGAGSITVHGRTRQQGYGGRADWNEIAKVVRAVKIPVIANGDVCCRDDLIKVKEVTGCAGVMIGRAALGRPWIFNEILHGGGSGPICITLFPNITGYC